MDSSYEPSFRVAKRDPIVVDSKPDIVFAKTIARVSSPETVRVEASPSGKPGRVPERGETHGTGDSMPRRKRVDPVDAPIDGGDLGIETVLNKDPSKHYAWIHPEDQKLLRLQGREMTKTDRRADGPNGISDIYSEGDIRINDLVLMEMSKDQKDAIDAKQNAEFARRHKGERTRINNLMKTENDEVSFAGSRYAVTNA